MALIILPKCTLTFIMQHQIISVTPSGHLFKRSTGEAETKPSGKVTDLEKPHIRRQRSHLNDWDSPKRAPEQDAHPPFRKGVAFCAISTLGPGKIKSDERLRGEPVDLWLTLYLLNPIP